jgi:hypothetical protein
MSKTVKIIIVVAILGLGIAVYLFIKKKQTAGNTNNQDTNATGTNTTGANTSDTNTTGSNTTGTTNTNTNTSGLAGTISSVTAGVIADQILACMNKVGTDEQKIFEILEGMTGTDIKKVIDAFGVKPYYGTGLRSEDQKDSIFSVFVKKGNFNLLQWFEVELSRKGLDSMDHLLKSKGVIQ